MSAPYPGKDIHKSCICHNLHQLCDPNTCKATSKSKDRLSGPSVSASTEPPELEWAVTTTMEGLRRSARSECLTCGILFHGILKILETSHWAGAFETKFKDMEVQVKDRGGHVVVTYHNTDDGIFGPKDYIDFYAKAGSSEHSFLKYSLLCCEDTMLIATEGYHKLCQAFSEVHELSKHTASNISFENLGTWIKDCEKHKTCSSAATPLPRRVICVGLKDNKSRQESYNILHNTVL